MKMAGRKRWTTLTGVTVTEMTASFLFQGTWPGLTSLPSGDSGTLTYPAGYFPYILNEWTWSPGIHEGRASTLLGLNGEETSSCGMKTPSFLSPIQKKLTDSKGRISEGLPLARPLQQPSVPVLPVKWTGYDHPRESGPVLRHYRARPILTAVLGAVTEAERGADTLGPKADGCHCNVPVPLLSPSPGGHHLIVCKALGQVPLRTAQACHCLGLGSPLVRKWQGL